MTYCRSILKLLAVVISLYLCEGTSARAATGNAAGTAATLTTPTTSTVLSGAASSTKQKNTFPIVESNSIQRLSNAGDSSKQNSANSQWIETRTTPDSRALKRVFLSNRTVTCNDGSQAGFYLRKMVGAKRWVVFFEGGWHCYDQKSCRTRWLRLRHLMTSAHWPETRDVGGILSPIPDENPFWHDANHVLVPYCSSDSWSGTKSQPDSRDGWRFMGSLIVRQVIADLIPLGLGNVQGNAELLLAGSSAGGLGVMLNLDKVKSFLHNERGLRVTVRGVSDSGWFVDREPYAAGAVAASEVVRQGWRMWQGALPEACTAAHTKEPWRCYFGHRIYPTLKAPLFIFQWLFDEAQMRADSVGAPVTPQQWDYIHEMGGALRTSLDNVTAVFAPSCIGHSVLTKRDWLHIKIDDISLADALRCWERSTGRSRKQMRGDTNEGDRLQNEQQRRRRRRRKQQQLESGGATRKHPHRHAKERRLTQAEREQREQRQRRRKERQRKAMIATQAPRVVERSSKIDRRQQRAKNRGGGGGGVGGSGGGGQNKRNRVAQPKRCSNLRLLERCSWPQCNHSCPTLTNPLTGEEMRFLELLASFGLDIEAVAQALGVDMQTLNNMEHTELVNLLTQQVS